jgi:hypothetical protein
MCPFEITGGSAACPFKEMNILEERLQRFKNRQDLTEFIRYSEKAGSEKINMDYALTDFLTYKG